MYRARIVAAAAAATLVAGAASAQGVTGFSGFYAKGFGGWTIPQNDDFRINDKATGGVLASGLDYNTGYILGVAGGYKITPNMAVELEYAFRNADADYKNTPFNGTTQSNAIMANAIYTFDGVGPNGAFRPYLGAGLGAADLNVQGKGGVPDFNGSYNFAYQLITGVAYDLNPNWTLNGEVRYFGIQGQTLDNSQASFKSGYSTYDALVGVSYHF
jgi:opacity protein-like surface antigen